ncbi:MAG: hypothetical protein MJ052_05860, partial [Sphaerochaetaceae bacterium]|nr:hypothetical protein [Sphaerochaetaceae bacterium]
MKAFFSGRTGTNRHSVEVLKYVSLTIKMNGMKVLSIEASTSSARAMIYDSEKGVLRTKSAAYGSKIDRGGIMNINGVCDLVFTLAREITADEKDIEAVGICGTWHNMCVFNRENHPVTDLYSWNYTGYGKIWDLVRKDKTLTDEFYTRTGCMPHTTYSRTAIKYLKDNGLVLEDKKFATFRG